MCEVSVIFLQFVVYFRSCFSKVVAKRGEENKEAHGMWFFPKPLRIEVVTTLLYRSDLTLNITKQPNIYDPCASLCTYGVKLPQICSSIKPIKTVKMFGFYVTYNKSDPVTFRWRPRIEELCF